MLTVVNNSVCIFVEYELAVISHSKNIFIRISADHNLRYQLAAVEVIAVGIGHVCVCSNINDNRSGVLKVSLIVTTVQVMNLRRAVGLSQVEVDGHAWDVAGFNSVVIGSVSVVQLESDGPGVCVEIIHVGVCVRYVLYQG